MFTGTPSPKVNWRRLETDSLARYETMLVDWKKALSPSLARLISVGYSSLQIPEMPHWLDRDIAQLSIDQGGLSIDIEWSGETEKFIVTLYRHEYENQLAQVESDS